MSPTRRDFLGAGATLVAGLALPPAAQALQAAGRSGVSGPRTARPVLISSSNGFRTKHADGRPAIQVGYDMLVRGADPLDAAVAAVQLVELDPTDTSVGLGGLPNADGVVQLDASCMHGPTKRAGAVACLEGIATPSLVAKAVMDHTDHVLLVGADAKRFALKMGFTEQNLLTEKSRAEWLKWKRTRNATDAWLDASQAPASPASSPRTPETGGKELDYDEHGVAHTWGTINMNAVDANGDVSSVTTTSGMAWKIPGRVGDSPIIGAGQYCDNTVGAAGSTGRGEANIKVCGAFLAVEFMRQGMAPEQALIKTMDRVIAMTESRLLDARGRPRFDLQFYAVAKDGRFAGATAYEGSKMAVCDSQGPRLVDCAYLFKNSERPR
jgi:N4-(beta-N-acetylglucosaminyl)-L-asparaginase